MLYFFFFFFFDNLKKCFAVPGFGTDGSLIGMVVWGFDRASPTSPLGQRRPGGSSPAAWSLLRIGFSSFCLVVFPVYFVFCLGCNPTSVWAFFSRCGTLFWACAQIALFVESQLWL